MLPCLTIVDLPFLPRHSPWYEPHIAELIVGVISIRAAFLKVLIAKDGQAFPSQRLLKTTFFIFGTLMVMFGILDLILKIP
jgi:hypothetical protein